MAVPGIAPAATLKLRTGKACQAVGCRFSRYAVKKLQSCCSIPQPPRREFCRSCSARDASPSSVRVKLLPCDLRRIPASLGSSSQRTRWDRISGPITLASCAAVARHVPLRRSARNASCSCVRSMRAEFSNVREQVAIAGRSRLRLMMQAAPRGWHLPAPGARPLFLYDSFQL